MVKKTKKVKKQKTVPYKIFSDMKKKLDDTCYELNDAKSAFREERSNKRGFICLLGLIVFLLLLTLFGASDNVDIDDVLAPYMCLSHNKTVESVQHTNMNFMSDKVTENNFERKNLRIVCKDKQELKPLDDGYLLIR